MRTISLRFIRLILSQLRAAWADPRPGNYERGTSICLSCLLAAGRTKIKSVKTSTCRAEEIRVFGPKSISRFHPAADTINQKGELVESVIVLDISALHIR